VRFVPQANLSGTATLTFRAWDRSSGSAGAVVNPGAGGGSSAFSAATQSVALTVTPRNDAPVGTSVMVTIAEEASYTLQVADFGFGDPNDAPAPNVLSEVVISSLPTAGTLRLAGTDVTLGQAVSRSDIDAGRLVFIPAANANGTAYASFGFQVVDDGGTANGGADTDPTVRTFTFNVIAVSDAPQGVDSTITLLEDAPASAIRASLMPCS
jgi:hypothetical protein